MKQIDFEGQNPIDIIGLINTGEKIVDASLPFINMLIAKIQDAGNPDNVHTPKGRTNHILAIEALDKLQTQKLDLFEKYFAQLIEKGTLEV